jgi:type II secretory pathway pseudopilin PulG
MFSLILTLIGIALVAVLALATLYYGGVAFKQGASAAEAAQVVNEGQQVRAALTLYQNAHGETASSLDELVTNKYLSAAPKGWALVDGYAYTPTLDEGVCLAANRKVGIDLIPQCSDAEYATTAPCCR